MKNNKSRIELIVGDRPDAHLTRIIDSPTRVWLKHPDEVGHETVEIESEDGTTTLLSFRHIPLEETERQLPENA